MARDNKKGVAALMVVIVVVGVILGISFVITELAINELVIDFNSDQANRLLQISDACAEESYFRLKRDSSYTGSTYSIGDGSCTSVVTGGGSTRTIDIEAEVGNLTRDFTSDVTIQTNVATNATGMDLTDWVESF